MATDNKVEFSKKDKKAQSIIDECYNNCNRFYEDRRDNLDLYEGKRRKREYNQTKHDHVYRSHIGGKIVEQMSTFVAQALTNEGGKIFTVSDYNNIAVARQASAATTLLNYYMNNLPLNEELYLAAWEAELYGTGVIEVEYKTTYVEVPDPESNRIKLILTKEGKFGAEKATKYIKKPDLRQPFIRHVRLEDFWVDKSATSMNNLRYACVREIMNYEDVVQAKDKYEFRNLAQAKKAGMPQRQKGTTSDDNSWRDGHRQRTGDYDAANQSQYNCGASEVEKKNPKVELIKIYTPGMVQFVMNGVVISDKQRIYPGVRFPFEVFRNDPKPGEFYGRSTIELVRNDIEFNEELTSLIHDKYLMNLKPIFLADSGAFMSNQLEEYKNAGPGDIISVMGLNIEAIREVRAEAPDPATINFANKFEQDAKSAAALNPLMDGGQDISSGVRTQGSFELVSRLGSTRVQNKIRIYAKAFENIGRLVLQMAKIFADEEEYISVTGALGDTVEQFVDPREIDTRVKFKVKLGQIADPARATRMAQQLNWLSTAAQLDQLGIVRVYKGLAEAAATGDLFEDSVGLLETDPEVIESRAFLMSETAGLSQPSTIPSLGSYSSMQQQQAPQEDPNQQAAQQQPQPAQASSIPQPTEGN